jgi:hypothetical protein
LAFQLMTSKTKGAKEQMGGVLMLLPLPLLMK